jgi:isoamylase
MGNKTSTVSRTSIKKSQRESHDLMPATFMRGNVRAGSLMTLGITKIGEGVNFAIFTRYATRVRLELFDHPEDATPARAIDLDPAQNRTGDVWHVWVKGIGR